MAGADARWEINKGEQKLTITNYLSAFWVFFEIEL
jgi:hypothetical protein